MRLRIRRRKKRLIPEMTPTPWYSRPRRLWRKWAIRLTRADKTAVEADLQALKDLVANTNPDEMTESQVADLKAGKEKLMESAQKLFAKVYEQAQGAAGSAGQAGPDMGAGNSSNSSSSQDDDVVDGDYRKYNFSEENRFQDSIPLRAEAFRGIVRCRR